MEYKLGLGDNGDSVIISSGKVNIVTVIVDGNYHDSSKVYICTVMPLY